MQDAFKIRSCELKPRRFVLLDGVLMRYSPDPVAGLPWIWREVQLSARSRQMRNGPWFYYEVPPAWHNDKPYVMNERPCHHEENGVRGWKLT